VAIWFAIETGMRLQEIFNLTWKDIDPGKRRVKITKSETDHMNAYKGRTIVLTVRAWAYLSVIFLSKLRELR
jgi:integrase